MSAIQKILEDAVDSGSHAGIAAISCNSDGVTFAHTYGTAGAVGNNNTPLATNPVFVIASMTKAITSVAALMLVDRGALALDSPIEQWVPALAAPPVLTGFDGDKPLMRRATRPITLRHLLTHSAGLGYTAWDERLTHYRTLFPDTQPIAGPDVRLAQPLVADPGERWMYSTATDWVGITIEAASGLPLGEFFRQNLFAPLGMYDTSFKLSDEQYSRLVLRHARETTGDLIPLPPGEREAPERGGGGLFSTAADYALFLRAMLRELRAEKHVDTPLLSPRARAGLSNSQFRDRNVGRLITSEPRRSNDAHFLSGYEPSWTLGFLHNALPVPGRRAAGSLMWGGIMNTYFWLDPTSDIAGVLCTQIAPFADGPTLDLFARFESAVYESAG